MFACCYEARREAEFTIGWNNANQLNDYQMRKSKNKEVTGKITTAAIIQGQGLPYSHHRQVPSAYDLPARDSRDCTPIDIQTPLPPMRTFPKKSLRN